jgi:UDP-N-acetylglucosamine--N-acetylmuramyl-(pentapeptide) pyrophosphoryl-undecaprenol N-acetylglucosamine transferase
MTKERCALIMAGGTGGHIFPALAVARALKAKGWRVHWLGSPNGMESKLVPADEFDFESLEFQGVRGQGFKRWLILPWHLIRAFRRCNTVLFRVKPDVVLGFGGYISFPAGVMARLAKIPLFVHEQNAVPGLVNKILARCATRVFSTFPSVLPHTEWVGNPLRSEFLEQDTPSVRFADRTGALKIVVMGGSLGSKRLNEVVPQALNLLPESDRPIVLHQSGESQLKQLRENYEQSGVQAEIVPFISAPANAFSEADLVICRAGASTVSEIAVVGVAAIFVPFPHAVDDHQTRNAHFLSTKNAAWLYQQAEFTPQLLANLLKEMNRDDLLQRAIKAQDFAKRDATEKIVQACQEIFA